MEKELKKLENEREQLRLITEAVMHAIRNMVRRYDETRHVTTEPATSFDLTVGLDAARLFPIELWSKIFSKIDASADFVSVQKTCKLFRAALHSCQSTFLFENAFQVFHPFMANTVDVLSCRLVCIAWKTSVDYCIRGYLHKPSAIIPSAMLSTLLRRLKNAYHFRNAHTAHSLSGLFINEMQHHRDSNPFIGNMVWISVPQNIDLSQNHFCPIIQRFGNHIHYLQFSVPDYTNGELTSQIRHFLRKVLPTLTPNLKRLKLEGYIPSHFCPPAEHAFPQLCDLQIAIMRIIPAPGMITLTHLKSLSVQWTAWHKWELFRQKWTTLTSLILVDFDENDVEATSLQTSHLPSLQKLGITTPHHWQKRYSPEMIIQLLHDLSATTKLTTLQVTQDLYLAPNTKLRLAPPNITSIDIEHLRPRYFVAQNTYTFLLYFPLLEHLRLCWKDPDEQKFYYAWHKYDAFNHFDYENDILDLHKLICQRCNAYDATIWKLLPKLNTLIIGNMLFTRRGYDDANKN